MGRAVQRLDPPAWGVGATLPSFVVSSTLALLAAVVDRTRKHPVALRG